MNPAPIALLAALRSWRLARLPYLCLLLPLLLTACGFHLRGAITLPYRTFHVALPATSEVGANLKRYLRASNSTELVDAPGEAEAILIQTGEVRQKAIISVNTSGLVREYQLRLNYSFRLVNPRGEELVPNNRILLTRDITFNDSAILAKDQEEALLWKDMQNDLVQQILRRLVAVRPKVQTVEEEE